MFYNGNYKANSDSCAAKAILKFATSSLSGEKNYFFDQKKLFFSCKKTIFFAKKTKIGKF